MNTETNKFSREPGSGELDKDYKDYGKSHGEGSSVDHSQKKTSYLQIESFNAAQNHRDSDVTHPLPLNSPGNSFI